MGIQYIDVFAAEVANVNMVSKYAEDLRRWCNGGSKFSACLFNVLKYPGRHEIIRPNWDNLFVANREQRPFMLVYFQGSGTELPPRRILGLYKYVVIVGACSYCSFGPGLFRPCKEHRNTMDTCLDKREAGRLW